MNIHNVSLKHFSMLERTSAAPDKAELDKPH
jgi:hypothetical protein